MLCMLQSKPHPTHCVLWLVVLLPPFISVRHVTARGIFFESNNPFGKLGKSRGGDQSHHQTFPVFRT
jgi:hypothetical protein